MTWNAGKPQLLRIDLKCGPRSHCPAKAEGASIRVSIAFRSMIVLIERYISFDIRADAGLNAPGLRVTMRKHIDERSRAGAMRFSPKGGSDQVGVGTVGASAVRRPGELGAAAEIELGVDVMQMHLHRAFGHV